MAKAFVPETPLEKLICKGKRDAVVDLLRAMSAAERQKLRGEVARLVKITQAARFSFGDDTFAGWGSKPSDEQLRAVAAAAVLCGTAKDAAEGYFDIDDVVALGKEFAPPSLVEMPVEMMKTTAWRVRIGDVQKLIVAGLSPRPASDEYVLGLMLLNRGAPNRKLNFDDHFAADPGLGDVLLRLFEVEGTQDVSLASVDKYSHADAAWSKRFLELIARGVYSRALLIDKTLGTLERGWIQFRSGWFSQFHVLLAPNAGEMAPHAQRYAALLASRIPPTVTFALDMMRELEKAGAIEPASLLQALRPVFSSAVKSQVSNALKLVDRLVKREPALAAVAASMVIPGLAHEAADVQQQILKRLEAWKVDAATRAQLADYSSGIAAVNREVMGRLERRDGAWTAARIESPAPSKRALPLDASQRLSPIESLDELIERVAFVLENGADVDEFERALAALVRAAPFDAETRKRFAPLAKRVDKLRTPISQQLGRMLHFLLTGERKDWGLSVDHSGNANLAQLHLIERVAELMKMAPRTSGLWPLATPTHRHGYIEPREFVERMAAFDARDVEPGRLDFLTGLLRLAPRAAPHALIAARALADGPAARALRHALGDEVPVKDAAMVAAAKRLRALVRGETASAREWRIDTEQYSNGMTHTFFWIARGHAGRELDPVAALENKAANHPPRYPSCRMTVGGVDEGCIRYYATLLPGDLENFCAEGAQVIGANIDWWEAQWSNKAYLLELLRADVPFRAESSLMLALALAGKEPGQTAIAVDALAAAHAEGRLDARLLGDQVTRLLREGHTACARYAKSLRAALRIDAAAAPAVFAVLCAAITARPDDPPKDTSALLELLLEIALGQGHALPEETRNTLQLTKIGGKGAALRAKLLKLT